METYKQAQQRLFEQLAKEKWDVKTKDGIRPMKVPYATSPDGDIRVYFKPQAVWASFQNVSSGLTTHSLKTARTIWMDIRDMSVDDFIKHVKSWKI